jgi:hypothetical protein
MRDCSVRKIVLAAAKYWTKKVAWSSDFFPGQAPIALVMSWLYQELLLTIYSSQDIFHSNWVCGWTSPAEFVRLGEHKQAELILPKKGISWHCIHDQTFHKRSSIAGTRYPTLLICHHVVRIRNIIQKKAFTAMHCREINCLAWRRLYKTTSYVIATTM